MGIQTQIQIDPVSSSDRDAFLALVLDPALTVLMGNGGRWQPAFANAIFERMLAEWRLHRLASSVLRLDQALVGVVAVEQAEPKTVEIVALIAPPAQKQGIATIAVTQTLQALGEQGYWRAVARCRTDNQAARRLAAKVGLRAVGIAPRKYGDDGTALLFAKEL